MTVVSSVTRECFSRSLGRRADWKNLNKLSRYEAAEIYTFSLKQPAERKVTRGKNECGKMHCFKIGGTLHLIVD